MLVAKDSLGGSLLLAVPEDRGQRSHQLVLDGPEAFQPEAQEDRIHGNQLLHHRAARLVPAGVVGVIGGQGTRRPQPLLFVSLGRLLHHGPEPVNQFVLVWQQGIADDAPPPAARRRAAGRTGSPPGRGPPAAGPGWRAVACASRASPPPRRRPPSTRDRSSWR